MIPINYQYPLSAAIYKILQKADGEYAHFLHQTGYGKGFKLFCFSNIFGNFKLEADRLQLLGDRVSFQASFHLPEASQNFVKGLFLSQNIEIADKYSKASFAISSVEALPNPLLGFKENEIMVLQATPISPLVAGLHNQSGSYKFLSPQDEKFAEVILYNWRNKISSTFGPEAADNALLLASTIEMQGSPKSRLVTIKAGTPQQTKIRGWLNFGLKLTAERRFVELMLNAGAGSYNAQGMGMLAGQSIKS